MWHTLKTTPTGRENNQHHNMQPRAQARYKRTVLAPYVSQRGKGILTTSILYIVLILYIILLFTLLVVHPMSS